MVSVTFAASQNHLVVMATQKGYLYKFPIGEIALMTAKSSGAKPAKISKKDRIVSMDLIDSEDLMVLMSDRGHSKIINPLEIPISTVNSVQKAETIFMADEIIGGTQAISRSKKKRTSSNNE
ncbi:hypothetical protein AAX21_03430 [Oenococcus oeni]|nr:hypothetical protein AAX21_03430 [Oenococcus oeni]